MAKRNPNQICEAPGNINSLWQYDFDECLLSYQMKYYLCMSTQAK